MSDRKVVPIARPAIGEEEWMALREPIESGWITQGPIVARFEKDFAKRHDARHAIAVSSCTTGLHLILVALGIGHHDEVIVPSFTWVATANAVLQCGATPIFVDINKDSFNINPDQVESKITNNTKAIIPVHLFGLCANIDSIRSIVPDDVKIVEDAACASGASYKGRSAGTLGNAAAFSFHPRKSITTGEGGMITTNDDELAGKLNQLRNHGAAVSEEKRHVSKKPYQLADHEMLGFNYRMSDLQGAVGRVQLGKLDRFIDEREKWAEYYCDKLADIEWLQLPQRPVDGRHGWQAFVTYIKPDKVSMSRDEIMTALDKEGVSVRPGTHAIHMLSYYKNKYKFEDKQFPESEYCNNHSMAIPLHNCMSEEDYSQVVDAIKKLS